MNKFSPQIFFDLSNFEFPEIFDGVDYVWEVIPRIEKLIDEKIMNKKILLGKGTVVHKTAVIQSPVIIGENCFIGPHSFIRENCIISDNCRIGHSTELKNSILFKGAILSHQNYVCDSIIGSRVNMSAGAITANLRLDRKDITIKNGEDRIGTGLRKFGAIVGDDSFVGVNSVLNPGTILGKNTVVYPLSSVIGVHEDNETIK